MKPSALDSAIALLDISIECDETRLAAIDFKFTLLAGMKKYLQGSRFTDSLQEEDFAFPYKKRFLSKAFRALAFENNKDTLNSNRLYREISNDIEQYFDKRHPGEKEFQEFMWIFFL